MFFNTNLCIRCKGAHKIANRQCDKKTKDVYKLLNNVKLVQLIAYGKLFQS